MFDFDNCCSCVTTDRTGYFERLPLSAKLTPLQEMCGQLPHGTLLEFIRHCTDRQVGRNLTLGKIHCIVP